MVKQTIQIFCRVKPTKHKTGIYSIEEDETISKAKVEFVLPKDSSEGYINNKRESYSFGFQKVFDQQVKQDLIFEHVAEGVVDNVLSGYNGTIFAYGQTGSGKTFTITGGAEKYDDRGIIPRALSYIYQKYEEDKDHIYTTEVSYLEIYNESGFDLLDPRHEATKLEDLPKVALMEDPDQNVHLKNLSLLPAQNEEEALNLLFLGDTNRMIAETPMNQASTRSHCIFTVHITSREPGSATIKRSKLHLVDLAGSERVSKSGVGGHLLTEAKYINLSLHFLEQVIVALSEKKRQHIPYRNSMMTSVLRDSLGGNCMTTMIATIAVDKKNVDESISTCRFAQRVAMIKNEATLNEELDPKLMILRLKREVQSLKDELLLVTGEQKTDQLTQEEIEKLNERLKIFLEDDDLESSLDVGGDMRKIQYCYKFLKDETKKHPPQEVASPLEDKQVDDEQPHLSPEEIQRLREILQQRDNEISILVSMLKKERKRALDAERRPQINGSNIVSDSQHDFDTTSAQNANRSNDGRRQESANIIQQKSRIKDIPMSMGKQEAFEIFKQDYTSDTNVLDQKELLKHRYSEAKSLGQAVNSARNDINHLKASLDHVRKQMGITDEEDSFEEHEKEQSIIHEMEEAKSRYKSAFQKLKSMKAEIDHLHHLMDKARVQMQHDFDDWWNAQSKSRHQQRSSRPSSRQHVESNRHHVNRNAWRTPPISPAKVPPIGSRSTDDLPISLPPTNPTSPREMTRDRQSIRSNNILSQRTENNGQRFSSTDILHSNRDRYSPNTSERNSYARPPSAVRSSRSVNGLPLTGDKDTDADIMAFVKARESMIKRQQEKGR